MGVPGFANWRQPVSIGAPQQQYDTRFAMPYSPEQMHELDVLIRYNLGSSHQGIKVHKSASPEIIDAVGRLYQKGLITHKDGGYLTELGVRAAEHAQALMMMLAPHSMAS